jgi:hypothetical protein
MDQIDTLPFIIIIVIRHCNLIWWEWIWRILETRKVVIKSTFMFRNSIKILLHNLSFSFSLKQGLCENLKKVFFLSTLASEKKSINNGKEEKKFIFLLPFFFSLLFHHKSNKLHIFPTQIPFRRRNRKSV